MDGLRRLLHGERDARAPRSCSLQVVGFDKECAFGEARKLASCRLQVGAPSPALLCFRFVWLYLKWLGSLLGWADLPNGWPAALVMRRVGRSRLRAPCFAKLFCYLCLSVCICG